MLRSCSALVWLAVRTLGLSGRAALLAEGSTVALLGPALTVAVLWLQAHMRPFDRLENRLRGNGGEVGRGVNPLFLL